jgi:hypothetical protein
MSTLTFTDASVLEAHDFAPRCCARVCLTDGTATHVIYLRCGCCGLACKPCADRCVRLWGDAMASFRARGSRPRWTCRECHQHGYDFPVKSVQPL